MLGMGSPRPISKSTYWIFIKLRRFEAHLELKCKDSYLNTWDVNSALLCSAYMREKHREAVQLLNLRLC